MHPEERLPVTDRPNGALRWSLVVSVIGTRSLPPNQPESLTFRVRVNADVPSGAVITNSTFSIDSDETIPYYGAPITTTVN